MATDRRLLLCVLAGAASVPLLSDTAFAQGAPTPAAGSPRGVAGEGQRAADLGNGFYQNPVLAGDHPDPSILKDGDVYYAAFSSFDYMPGLPLWRSEDLVNWVPVGAALRTPVGSIYAPDLVKHDGRYFIYFATVNYSIGPGGLPLPKPGKPLVAVYVIHADTIAGPWSEPIDLGIGGAIDPGHAVGEDGKRYLFLSDGRRIGLSDDGLSTRGTVEKVYQGWKYPADWIVEGYSFEGPKISKRDGWFYLTSAVGGTAGPPTGHMVIVARSRSIHGPWEDCPHNPIVRTRSVDEPWWSRGHATIVEGPAGDFWLAYHGIENGRRTLGRQMLLEPMTWTADGWPRAMGGDLRVPLRKPRGGRMLPPGRALTGPFTAEMAALRFPMFAAESKADLDRIRFEDGAMIVAACGSSPADCSPLGAVVGDPRYELSVELELTGNAQGGLILFYSRRAYCGLGTNGDAFLFPTTGPGLVFAPGGKGIGRRLHLRIVNDRDVASFYHSPDGARWTLYRSVEVAGFNHNVFGEFLSLRPALYAAGDGHVSFRNVRYRASAT